VLGVCCCLWDQHACSAALSVEDQGYQHLLLLLDLLLLLLLLALLTCQHMAPPGAAPQPPHSHTRRHNAGHTSLTGPAG